MKIKDTAKLLSNNAKLIDRDTSIYYRINKTYDLEIYGDFSEKYFKVTLLVWNISRGKLNAEQFFSLQGITSISHLKSHFDLMVKILEPHEDYLKENDILELTNIDLSDDGMRFDYCIGEISFISEKHGFIKEEGKRKEYQFTRKHVPKQANKEFEDIKLGDCVHFMIKKTVRGERLQDGLTGLYFPH